jgi:DNA-binding transcriptional LysR family regulator
VPISINLSRFDQLSIQLVLTCAQTGSLSAAAQQLHIAIAAASRRLKELESASGMLLFERHAKGLRPTEAGRIFVRHGLAFLQTTDQLTQELTDLQQGVKRHLKITASTAAINQFLPGLLAAFIRKNADVQIDLEEQVSEQVIASLREGHTDVGIFVETALTDELKATAFANDELILVVPSSHKLSRSKAPIDFEKTLDEDFISLNTGAALLTRMQQEARIANKPLKLRMQVRSFDAVCNLVAAGLGIAVLPKASTEPLLKHIDIKIRSLANPWAKRALVVAVSSGELAQEFKSFLIDTASLRKTRTSKR